MSENEGPKSPFIERILNGAAKLAEQEASARAAATREDAQPRETLGAQLSRNSTTEAPSSPVVQEKNVTSFADNLAMKLGQLGKQRR